MEGILPVLVHLGLYKLQDSLVGSGPALTICSWVSQAGNKEVANPINPFPSPSYTVIGIFAQINTVWLGRFASVFIFEEWIPSFNSTRFCGWWRATAATFIPNIGKVKSLSSYDSSIVSTSFHTSSCSCNWIYYIWVRVVVYAFTMIGSTIC